MDNFTFALPASYDQYCIKSFTKRVKTKAFVKAYKTQLANIASRLTSSNVDATQVIGAMLQVAYGANIGRQIEDRLSNDDIKKIKNNIIEVVYYS